MMLLSHFVDFELPDALRNIEVSGFSLDNHQIADGMVFVALNGTQTHGLKYAGAAVQAGASVVLYEPEGVGVIPELEVPVLAVSGLANKLGVIASRFYGQPSHYLSVVGVTGTDGKTSVTHFIAEAQNALDKQAAVLGTIGIGKPGNLEPATHTTPDAVQLHARLRALAGQGFESVAMEVSSHALDQARVGGVRFDTVVLTNLTRDHLDYHGTVEAYAEAKRKLFHWDGVKAAVLNLDDAFGRELANELQGKNCDVLGYGVGNSVDYPPNAIVASNAYFDHNGIHAEISSPWGLGALYAPVLGRFNLENLLATLAVLLAQGVEFSSALIAMQQVNTVPGRMERVHASGQQSDALVVVDYAHTPGALTSVLSALKGHVRQRLICVFGCGGDRDVGKRPLMAAIAEQLADVVIVTNDNPRTESPEHIFTDIRAGFNDPNKVIFEHDRANAIRRAITSAEVGDVVLIAGKGHETVQVVQQESLPFDDREQAEMALQERAA
uniref:UDP-N-acetylmuramoyl-L-alanyl-D-glutamate--2,6-diaminopimelate ligase n=1 Tax=uncultured Thiotrichaceae bacterium TaxID=298394 RepID=A0A6S6ULZ1_9GAMM|nr:MAG: UDP-N-acetylmuramoylalanyl-D-glutamate--2,6-diaminopimelate ligase (EC [uncultured Thiotrichaceae bacterium]